MIAPSQAATIRMQFDICLTKKRHDGQMLGAAKLIVYLMLQNISYIFIYHHNAQSTHSTHSPYGQLWKIACLEYNVDPLIAGRQHATPPKANHTTIFEARFSNPPLEQFGRSHLHCITSSGRRSGIEKHEKI